MFYTLLLIKSTARWYITILTTVHEINNILKFQTADLKELAEFEAKKCTAGHYNKSMKPTKVLVQN